MTGFDAEWYLRRSGEDALRVSREATSLADRARALVAVGKLDGSLADSIVTGYQRALALRGRDRHPWSWAGTADLTPAAEPSPTRTFSSGATFDIAWGTVTLRYVMLAADETAIGVRVRFDRAAQHRHSGPPQLTARDDQGQRITLHFNGGGSDHEWSGEFREDTGLSTTTRWLELDGTRVELDAAVEPVRVSVEPRCDDAAPLEERAADYLDYCLEHGAEWAETPLPASLDAFIACGALTPDSATFTAVRATCAALTGPVADRTGLAPKWRSILEGRARSGQGPRGWVLVGTTTPVFDGLCVTLTSLTSGRRDFSVDFRVTGPVTTREWAPSVLLPILTFSAVDDLGNHYLGMLGSHGGGPGSLAGDIQFPTPLHPAAIRLDLTLSTARARATFEIPLRFEDES